MSQLTRDEIKKQKDFDDEIIPHMDALYNFALRLTTDPNDAECSGYYCKSLSFFQQL